MVFMEKNRLVVQVMTRAERPLSEEKVPNLALSLQGTDRVAECSMARSFETLTV